jgi:hypothetical protein
MISDQTPSPRPEKITQADYEPQLRADFESAQANYTQLEQNFFGLNIPQYYPDTESLFIGFQEFISEEQVFHNIATITPEVLQDLLQRFKILIFILPIVTSLEEYQKKAARQFSERKIPFDTFFKITDAVLEHLHHLAGLCSESHRSIHIQALQWQRKI